MLGTNIRRHKNRIRVGFSLCFIEYHAMKTYGAIQVQLHAFSALALDGGVALDGGECPHLCPGHFVPEK
jgi:hypothetical protein